MRSRLVSSDTLVSREEAQTGDGGNAADRPAEEEVKSRSGLRSSRFVDLTWALVGGGVTALVLFAGVATVGNVTPFEGLRLLESILPTIRFLSSSVMAAVATVMALMLTLLSLTFTSRWEFREVHYRRIGQISILSTIAIILSVGVLLFLGLPVEEAEQLRFYYDVVYYSLTAAASLLGGLLIAIVLMLHTTIRGLIAIGMPGGRSHLIEDHEESTESP